jgi:DNA-directed RNA polymerase subunit K/omega
MQQVKKKVELPRVDVAAVLSAHEKTREGNRYTMILEAAYRARDIEKHRDFLDRKAEKLNYYGYKPINQALQDIIDDAA